MRAENGSGGKGTHNCSSSTYRTSKRTKKKITRGQNGRKTKRSLKPPTCLSEESKQGLWHRPVTSRSQEAETGDGELEAEPVSAPAVVPQPQHLWGAVLIALLGLSVLGRGMEQTEFLLASDRLQKKIKHSNGFLSTSTHIAPPTHNADSLSQEAFSFYFYYFPYGLLAPRGKHSGKNNLCVTSVRNFFKTNQSRDAGN